MEYCAAYHTSICLKFIAYGGIVDFILYLSSDFFYVVHHCAALHGRCGTKSTLIVLVFTFLCFPFAALQQIKYGILPML